MRIVGNSLPLNDGLEKVTGSAKFTADIRLPHMLHAKILRSPYPHAKILNIDTSQAEVLPGVKAVVREGYPGSQAGDLAAIQRTLR